jgi:hypothetical protein
MNGNKNFKRQALKIRVKHVSGKTGILFFYLNESFNMQK